MKPGDFILTPSWTYHDHGNPGTDAVVWLDGLDIPITNFFDTSFAERHPDKSQPVARREGDALARYGSAMLPLEYTPARPSSPMVTYPYARSRDALELLSKSGAPDARHGVKLQYVNPATGGYPLTTIGAFLQLLPKGFNGTAVSIHRRHGLLRRRGAGLEHDWRPHLHLGTARHLRRALLASGRASRAG